MNHTDTRYPYTYACDYVRTFSEITDKGVSLSRSEASAIIGGIADAIGMEKQTLAEKLADYYKQNEESVNAEQVAKLIARFTTR